MVEKVLRMFSKLDLQEIPPLVYQLLLLSAKVKTHRSWISPRFIPSEKKMSRVIYSLDFSRYSDCSQTTL